MENSKEETNKLFHNLNIPTEFVSEALKAMEKHSQNNMFDKSKTNNQFFH